MTSGMERAANAIDVRCSGLVQLMISKAADLMGLKSPAVNFPVRTASISGAPFW